jgi:hypothetical protein
MRRLHAIPSRLHVRGALRSVTPESHGFAGARGGGAARRIDSCSAVAIPALGEKGGSGGLALGFQAQAMCALAYGTRARKRFAMRRYKYNPRWITVRFECSCIRCKRSIHPGELAFYFPKERSLYCEGEECAKAASREFSAQLFDEENNASM